MNARIIKDLLTMLLVAVAGLSCSWLLSACGDPEDPAPKAITVNESHFTADQAGTKFTLLVRAPALPGIAGVPDWISMTGGGFTNYAITYSVTVAANETYEDRTATLTISSTGVSPVTVTVTQAGRVPEPTPPEPGKNDAWTMANKLGLGWNLGNQLDALYTWQYVDASGFNWYNYPGETAWGNPVATQATFNGVKAAGFTSVRIPVTWMNYIGAAPDYTIDATWMNRVYEVVQYARNAGLYVIINTHHDENHGDDHWLDIKNAANNSTLNQEIKAKIKGVWTQIATKFQDCGDWLIMEGFNELNDGGWGWSEDFRKDPTKQCNILNEWNQVFVDAVRATGGNNATRWLGIPTYAANPEFEKYLTMPTDAANRLMLSVHFYDPSDYTIGEKQYSDWGHTGSSSRKASGGDEDHVKAVFGNLNAKYVEKNIPCYLGEFGASMRSKSDNRAWAFYLYYIEYIVKAARTYGLPCFVWDNGAEGTGAEKHPYIHHGTGAYVGNSADVIAKMKKGWFTDSDSYTLQSVYDSAPKF